jgi:serine/threonine-protein kinase
MIRDGSGFGSADQMRAVLAGAGRRPATKVMAAPMFSSEQYVVAPRKHRRPMSRGRKLLLAAAAFVGLTVATLALALDPSSTTAPQPVRSNSAVPPPPPVSSSPPSPNPVPVVEEPPGPPKKKPEGRGPGNGPGNGNGNKKR